MNLRDSLKKHSRDASLSALSSQMSKRNKMGSGEITSFVQVTKDALTDEHKLYNVKLIATPSDIVPDFEADLTRKRSQIDSDPLKGILLEFPFDEVQYNKKKYSEKLAWYSLYGADKIQDINLLGKKTIELLSSKIEDCTLTYIATEYDQPFTQLPKFRPPSYSLYKHEFSVENLEFLKTFQQGSSTVSTKCEETVYSGYMEVYPTLIDSKEVEKWVNCNKPKKRFFSLKKDSNSTTYRLVYKKDDNPSSKFDKVLFIESCTGLKQTPSLKSNAFQIQINEKIIVFVVPAIAEYQKWVKLISDASGTLFEQSTSAKTTAIRKTTNMYETWDKSGMAILVEYSKENENINQKIRKEIRYKIFDIYPDLIEYSDTLPQEKQLSILPGDPIGQRILFEFKEVKFNFHYIEPFIACFAIYDIKSGDKMTEDFVCEPLAAAYAQAFKDYNVSEPYSNIVKSLGVKQLKNNSHSCIFTINYPLEHLYLVVKFFKMYTTTLSKIWEIYSKEDSKNEAKLGKQVKAGSDKVKKYLMPVGYSYKRLFTSSELDTLSKFSPIIKYDYRLTNHELCRVIREIIGDKGYKYTSMNAEINHTLLSDVGNNDKTFVTTANEAIQPFTESKKRIVREIENLPASTYKFQGYSLPVNILFVQLVSVNLTGVRTSVKLKNICISCELFDRKEIGGPEQLPIIFDRTSSLGFVRSCSSIVIFDCMNPNMMDEFKILLPAVYMANLHLLFTFRSVDHNEKGDNKKMQSADIPFGYTWIKIFENNNIITNGEYNVPVLSTFPVNYTSYNLEKPEKLKGNTDLKFLDSVGRPIFKFRVDFHSNYHTVNSQLYELINIVSKDGINDKTAEKITKHLKVLESLEGSEVINLLYPILHFLFFIMQEAGGMQTISSYRSLEIQRFSMRVMLRACGLVCFDGGENLLRGWVEKRFDPTFGTSKIFIQDVILSNLSSCFHYSTEPVLLNNFFYSLWFFLEVLVKCFAVDAITNNRVAKNRQYFLKSTTTESIKKLVSSISFLIKNKIIEDSKLIKKFAKHLGRFITRCFTVINRGLVMGILDIILENLKGNEPENVQIRLEILTHIANYKYFIQLNLPMDLPTNKNSIFLLREISKEYGSIHFPLYLILREVEASLSLPHDSRKFSIRLMRNLIKKHHFDDRYERDDVLCRIHMMYLPFLTMIIQKADLIVESVLKSPSDLSISMDLNEIPTDLTSGKSTLDQRKWVSHCKSTSSINTNLLKNAVVDVDSRLYTVSELRDIFTIFFQIIKCVDMGVLIDYLKCFTTTVFEQSRRGSLRGFSVSSLQKFNATNFLENFITILKSSISLFGVNYIKNIKNFKIGVSSFVPQAAKSQSMEAISNYENYIETNRKDLEINLQNEICIIILDVIERVYGIFKIQLEVDNGDNPLMKSYFELNLTLLQAHTSLHVKKCLFALLRQLMAKSPNVIFKGNNTYCYQLCVQIIKLSNTQNEWLQTETKYFIYLVLRCDYFFNGITYTRAYIAIITACSVTVQECKTMNFLLEMMRGLWDLVKNDAILNSGEFAIEVSDLTKRVKNIVRLTLRFSELENDPESLVDAHCSIASSFSGVPELRQMWIEKVSKLQEKYHNYSEAGMCHLLIAALITITLKRKGIIAEGLNIFKSCTPNITASDLNFKEEAMIDDNKHTVANFINQITMACDFFFKAERFELIPDLSKAIIPLLEKDDNYKGLSKVHEKLKNTYDKITELAGKRFLGTYYRVSFYGHSFKEEHGSEYIYKEPKLTPLPDIVERIKGIYSPFCTKLTIIQESTKVKWKGLDQNKDYIQINAVKPNYLDNKDAKSQFLCHHNMGSFVLETPFCLTGKAHGSISDQCKRITVFRTAQQFPFIKKRIQIINKEVIELTPIEVAIEEMTSQVHGLKGLVESPKPDKVQLELKLQGSVSVTVNAGPIAYANAFLKSDVRAKFNKNLKDRLMSIFKEFLEICGRAIDVYSSTIVTEQIPTLERYKSDYQTLSKNLYDILEIPTKTADSVSIEALI